MSRIWAALPLLEGLDRPPAPDDVCWWRMHLPANSDGYHAIMRNDSLDRDRPARLTCIEWFDELDEQLILGVDVFEVRQTVRHISWYLDVLSVRTPTRSPRWVNLTEPGDTRWPAPDGFGLPHELFTSLPYPVAPVVGAAGGSCGGASTASTASTACSGTARTVSGAPGGGGGH